MQVWYKQNTSFITVTNFPCFIVQHHTAGATIQCCRETITPATGCWKTFLMMAERNSMYQHKLSQYHATSQNTLDSRISLTGW